MEETKTSKKATRTETETVAPPIQAKPRRVIRTQKTFMHDLFKAEVAMMKKNTSYKRGEPTLLDVEHVHFYHSHNSQGKVLTITNSTGGHYHEVKTRIDEKGNLIAECGPPLEKKEILAGGKKKVIVTPVKFWSDERQEDIIDKHVHAMTYIHSEEMSPEIVKAIQQNNAAQMASFATDTKTVDATESV